ncbi:MAG: DnaD domain protein [Ruminococcus sp.]|nr:DnaD domain protein [Ruminococcus sp.]
METKTNNNDNVFNIPCVVVDNFLQMATGEYIKVLLYILRVSGRDFAENEISDETGVNQEEVNRAIDFWRRAKILTGNGSGSNTPDVQKTEEENVPENSSVSSKKYMKNYFSASDIAEIKNSDPEISELIELAENSLGILNNTQLTSIINMHNYLGLKTEVIITLIEYCKNIKKTYPKYMDSVASGWAENNINTLEEAQKEVERLLDEDEYKNKIKRIISTDRLSKNDEVFITEWHRKNIPTELIEEAYDVTINYIHKLDFKYMDSVIKSKLDGNESGTDFQKSNKNNNKNSRGRKTHYDKDFDADMYKIFINDFKVI